MTVYRMTGYVLLSFFIIAVVNPLYKNSLIAAENHHTSYRNAEALFKKKKFSEALSLYENILLKNPSFISAYRSLTKCYKELGDLQGAVIFIESLFFENPESAEVCYGLGYALYSAKKYNDSKIYFEKAIKLNPNLAEAWNNCAAIYHLVLQDDKKARNYYEKAISISRQTGNNRVLEIAKMNLARLPNQEVIQPVKENLTLEEFINRFIFCVDHNNKKRIRQLILGQKENSEQAMDWLLKQAMRAFAESNTEEEKTALLLARLLDQEYRNSFKNNLLKGKLYAYNSLSHEKKKMLIKGEDLINKGLKREHEEIYKEALQSYKDALSAFQDIKNISKTGIAYVYIGDVYRKMKKYDLARKAYHNGLSCFIEIGEQERKAFVLSELGKTYFFLKDYKNALQFLEQSLEAYRLLKDENSEKKVKQNIDLVKAKIDQTN
ncbi:MAG: tetratricopeptide repeat protein [Desulfobacterales bacterium]|nr:MAG: tetratricopeptide repeat protein [Desulfobacterales bacterium]